MSNQLAKLSRRSSGTSRGRRRARSKQNIVTAIERSASFIASNVCQGLSIRRPGSRSRAARRIAARMRNLDFRFAACTQHRGDGVSSVPEPKTFALFVAIGLAGMLVPRVTVAGSL